MRALDPGEPREWQGGREGDCSKYTPSEPGTRVRFSNGPVHRQAALAARATVYTLMLSGRVSIGSMYVTPD